MHLNLRIYKSWSGSSALYGEVLVVQWT